MDKESYIKLFRACTCMPGISGLFVNASDIPKLIDLVKSGELILINDEKSVKSGVIARYSYEDKDIWIGISKSVEPGSVIGKPGLFRPSQDVPDFLVQGNHETVETDFNLFSTRAEDVKDVLLGLNDKIQDALKINEARVKENIINIIKGSNPSTEKEELIDLISEYSGSNELRLLE